MSNVYEYFKKVKILEKFYREKKCLKKQLVDISN